MDGCNLESGCRLLDRHRGMYELLRHGNGSAAGSYECSEVRGLDSHEWQAISLERQSPGRSCFSYFSLCMEKAAKNLLYLNERPVSSKGIVRVWGSERV